MSGMSSTSSTSSSTTTTTNNNSANACLVRSWFACLALGLLTTSLLAVSYHRATCHIDSLVYNYYGAGTGAGGIMMMVQAPPARDDQQQHQKKKYDQTKYVGSYHHNVGEINSNRNSTATLDRPPTSTTPVATPTETNDEDDDEHHRLDVSEILNFAILGHAKCATTYINQYLNTQHDVSSFKHEVCDFYDLKSASLMEKITTQLDMTPTTRRGFKCPGHFSRRALRQFRQLWPDTRLVIGLRHPVDWFESYYNFRARHLKKSLLASHNLTTLPPPDQLIGECTLESQGVCTERAKFHLNLVKFGKTGYVSDSKERNLLQLSGRYEKIPRISNPIFIYEVRQIQDTNTTRRDRFHQDLVRFVRGSSGSDSDDNNITLPAAVTSSSPPTTTKPTTPSRRKTPTTRRLQSNNSSTTSTSSSKTKVFDICEARYEPLRDVLVQIGKDAATWIRTYFLHPHDGAEVFASNQDHFNTILDQWNKDPCKARRSRTTTQEVAQ